ncbi:hypothetical protein RHSIM_Rhsim13G0109500 [Rhododendron simsii]|uniref:Fatty acyl-CoA reductase n=1 Tax=Rhododendron simsii TaxID=118357 RepID=A0A834L7L3_RHOSS|nr:hypothetical protein RHSIM_Rhsim13G0109500 [Rhododendron simsii]
MGSIIRFFEDKTLLVTGGTGFLAKIMVEKILRIQPNVKKLFLLIRAKDAASATQRFHDEVIGTELFKVLREKWGEDFNSRISEKVIPVSGDVTSEDLISLEKSDLRDELWRDIDVIVHSAATTKFDERYDIAMGINVMGAMHVLNFAKKCTNIKMLLHVSTAYVCGEREGVILEKPFAMGETLNGTSGLDIWVEKQLVEEKLRKVRAEEATEKAVTAAMKDFGIQRATHFGWPNTYTFTKAMGEMVFGHFKGNLPLVIIRPSIITSTYQEPFPGWIEGLRTMDVFALGFGKGKLRCMLFDPESVADMIPGDMVVNSMLVAIAVNAAANQHPKIMIYHVGSSLRNPIRYDCIRVCAFRYFTKNPWIDKKSGNPVKVRKIRAFSNTASYQKYLTIHYLMPLKVFKLLNVALCHCPKATYINQERKIKFLLRLVELYMPYLFFKGIFDDLNTEKLRMEARERGGEEGGVFYFDPKSIDWEQYFMNIHFPGVVKHLF